MPSSVTAMLVNKTLDIEKLYGTKAVMPSSIPAVLVTRTLGNECQYQTKTVMPSSVTAVLVKPDVGQQVTKPKQGRDALIRDRRVG